MAGPGLLRMAWRGMALAALLLATARPASAEPVVDRALAGAEIGGTKACRLLTVRFNFRVRYASHFPVDRGAELRISVRAIDRAQAEALALLRREALRAPQIAGAGITGIELETQTPGGPELRVQFAAPVAYQVGQGADFESIVVAIAGPKPNAACRPVSSPRASPAIGVPEGARPAAKAAKPLDAATMGARIDEARAALRKDDPATAIRLLTPASVSPETPSSAEARELLGHAYQKAKRMDAARAAYEDYLARYPSGEGHDRVRQRLDALLTATATPAGPLRAARDQPGPNGAAAGNGPRPFSGWNASGSISQFYIRDDSYRVVRDPTLPPDPNPDPDANRVHRSTLLSSFDLMAQWGDGNLVTKFRFSGAHEHGFEAGGEDLVSVSTLYADSDIRSLGLSTRIGRQTRNTGGVLGRFDGGVVGYRVSPMLRINAVAGSPVASRRDAPFENERYFYGASVDFGPIWRGFDASLFYVEQRDRSLLDRRAVGAELRYLDDGKTLLATVDYDIYFQEWNAAILSASWTLADKSTIHGGLDYRRSPYLSAWTALQGQPFLTLYDMLKLHTKEEIDRLARDRTPVYRSAMIGYSRPIGERLQLSLDATIVDVSGTPASSGVPEMLGTGTEYYLAGQFIGSGWFLDGDSYTLGLRFADRSDSNLYALDLSARIPVTPDLRVSPRLRLGYRIGDTSDLEEVTVLPSVLVNYNLSRDFSFEIEGGMRWLSRQIGPATEIETDLFVTAGFRYDFYADDRSKCGPVPVNCR